MQLLPPTHNKTLRVLVIVGCTLLCCPLAVLIVGLFSRLFPGHGLEYTGGEDTIEALLPLLPIALLAWFILSLWRLTEWFRKFLTIIVVASSILFPLALINPYAAMEMGGNIPPVTVLVLKFYAPFLGALSYVYVLSRYRREFRKKIW